MGFDSFSTAVDYAQSKGFATFPVYGVVDGKCTCNNPSCASPGKHPATTKGLKAASKDPMVLEGLWAGRTNLNIGIATGIESGIFVLDVDGYDGQQSLEALLVEHGNLPNTLISKTARGYHYIFSYPDRKVFNRTHIRKNIDVRGDGGYIVAPNSMHISGVRYEWIDDSAPIAQAPQWLLDIVCADKKAPVVHTERLEQAHLTEWSVEDVRDMLKYISADGSNDDWVSIGMALQQGGYPVDLFDEWSATSPKYKKGEPIQRWRSFKPTGGITMGTLVDRAKMGGWKPKEYITEEPIDYTSPLVSGFAKKYSQGPYKKAKEVVKKEPEKTFPTGLKLDPMELHGIIGDTVRWIVGCSPVRQPELALLNTLACLGAVFGRRYQTPTGARTNLFACGIAGTGEGKDDSRKCLKKLMMAAGMETYITSENFKSGAGLETQIDRQPSCVMMVDEFGLVLKGIIGDNSKHNAEIVSTILGLYSKSNDFYIGGTYANKQSEPLTIYDPNLCIYGCTTLSTYLEAMKKAAIESGWLNRFITLSGRPLEIVETNDGTLNKDIPDHLLLAWCGLIIGGIGEMNKNIIQPDPRMVKWGNTEEYFKQLSVRQRQFQLEDDTKRQLYSRMRENILKVAMIFAVCDDIQNPIYDLQRHVMPAEAIVLSSIEYIVNLAQNEMYENSYHRSRNDVYKCIERNGGAGIMRRDLLSKLGYIKIRDMDDIIKVLLDSEKISVTKSAHNLIYKAR